MNKLFVRLVASGAIAVGLSASALADSASIDLTGPGSTNVITSSSGMFFNSNVRNWTALGNWNHQTAKTGNVLVSGNTKVIGFGLGSGTAFNTNSGENTVNINNGNDGFVPFCLCGGGGNQGSIFLTGPGSFNEIGFSNQNRFNSTVNNNVNAQNFSSQTARSGNITITGNTLVTGVGGSGNAINENSGANTVDISNSTPTWSGSWGSNGSNDASISTTGPHSANQIGFSGGTRINVSTNNNVNAQNFNQQSATSGSVNISGNTVVSGVGGSGGAFNSNMVQNDVGISN